MKWFVQIAVAVQLIGCSSAPPLPRSDDAKSSWLSQRKQQIREARLRAQAAGDFRPYPEGWPEGTLPFRSDPDIADAIRPGQTMAEVARTMGREGWSHNESRDKFLNHLRQSYALSVSRTLPENVGAAEHQLPAHGKFVSWQYQGFPDTADWIVVFFSTPQDAPNSEPRVIARGVFRLGCF